MKVDNVGALMLDHIIMDVEKLDRINDQIIRDASKRRRGSRASAHARCLEMATSCLVSLTYARAETFVCSLELISRICQPFSSIFSS